MKMVQRKLPNKLGIQAEEAKSDKSPSFQHQESTNRGHDLKKLMKKTRQNLGSTSFKRQVPSPNKKSQEKSSETTPNYMKSTSSSDARKEHSQVSPMRNFKASFDTKFSGKKNSDNPPQVTSNYVHKPARTLIRTSSLKLMRALKKTTNFKPEKRCSTIVLSENQDVQRATCSSTLKDSKFPDFLALCSGGTEAEGNSIMKVCPYRYCSLNGHHHPLLPPLKVFLSDRRRVLKAQRSMKSGCLSPLRWKQNRDPVAENEKPQTEESLFIHIYGEEIEGTKDETESNIQCTLAPEYSLTDNTNDKTEDEVYPDFSVLLAESDDLESHYDGQESIGSVTSMIEDFGSSDMDGEMEEYTTLCLDDQVGPFANSGSEVKEMPGESCDSTNMEFDVGLDLKNDESINLTCKGDLNQLKELIVQDEDEEDESIYAKKGDPETETDFLLMKILGNDAGVGVDEEDLNETPKSVLGIGNILSLQGFYEDVEAISEAALNEDGNRLADEPTPGDNHPSSNDKSYSGNGNFNILEETDQAFGQLESTNSLESSVDEPFQISQATEMENSTDSGQVCLEAESPLSIGISNTIRKRKLDQDMDKCNERLKLTCNRKELIQDYEEQKQFNPREPNFLPVKPDPEAEKVDLKHQMVDDRKNSEEWMLDYALQQAVTKLAPARKKKVALLVEAFEAVLPVSSKCQILRRHVDIVFDHVRPIQACS